jgi:hypothetical protein
LQVLEQRVRQIAQQKAVVGGGALHTAQELHDERLREYETLAAKADLDEGRDTVEDAEDGLIDGGSWEHRKRAAEMLKTAQVVHGAWCMVHCMVHGAWCIAWCMMHGAWCIAWCMVHGALHGAWCV